MLKEKKRMKTVWHPRQGMFWKLTWNGLFKMYSQGLFTIRSSAELHLRIPDQRWQDCVPGGETSTLKPFTLSFQLAHHLGALCISPLCYLWEVLGGCFLIFDRIILIRLYSSNVCVIIPLWFGFIECCRLNSVPDLRKKKDLILNNKGSQV